MGKLNRVVVVRMDEDLLDAIGKRIFPGKDSLWRRVDWPVAITWGVIAAVEFCIIYGAASYVMGAIR